MNDKIKSAFAFSKTEDGWNPHIVRVPPVLDEDAKEKLESESFLKILAEKGDEKYVRRYAKFVLVEQHLKEFSAKWHEAQQILRNKGKRKGIFPLAYRLEPVLSDELTLDPVDGNKFGGIPDLRHGYGFIHKKEEGLDKLIARAWPKCSCCHEYMNYLCGLSLGEWTIPIHLLTRRKFPKEGGQYEASIRSGLGFDGSVGAEHINFNWFWNVFYCREPHFDNPNSDSVVLKSIKYEESKLFGAEEYKKAVDEFVSANKIESNIPIQTVKGFNLRFDVDIPGVSTYLSWLTDLREDQKHSEIFGRDGDYQFFGEPRSQQTEKRPFCSNSYFNQHRFAPIVNWTDQEKDFTYQIDGCLRCTENFAPVWCKTDGSCT